jgi:uncharacterized protein
MALTHGDRIIDLDVTRGVALVGVCVMNYHGYLLNRGANPGTGFWARQFDPWHGPLSTRFAATFVVVAGMGISLLTRRSRATGDRAAISADRWVLVRRGVLLYAFGFFLNWVWPGTILFYYGAFFLVGALVCTLRSRWLVLLGTTAALAAAGLQWWVLARTHDGRRPTWFTDGTASAHTSPRDLVLDTFVRGTHPLLPWLLFLCAGMVLGRALPFTRRLRTLLIALGVACVVLGYSLHHLLSWHPLLRSTDPFDRGVLYSLTALGVAVAAVCIVGSFAQATARAVGTHMLAVTGRTTLTLYVLHVLVFNLVVDWLEWVKPAGLVTSLSFALVFWLVAIVAANAWALWQPLGPLEWLYRRFSDTRAAQPVS